MAEIDRRIAAATAGGLIQTLALAAVVEASTSPPPATTSPAQVPVEGWVAFPVAMLVIVVGTIVVLIARPGSRRPIAALAVAATSLSFGLVFVLAGLFGDWSGEHRIFWQFLIPGLVILVGGLAGSIRIARGRRREAGRSVG